MIRDELVERVLREWQRRLKLDYWDIKLELDESEPQGRSWEDHEHAAIWRSRDYFMATLRLHPNFRENWTVKELNINIVHELLHLLTREVENILDLTDGQVHRDVQTVIDQTFSHSLEGAVDNLAHRFVEIGGWLDDE